MESQNKNEEILQPHHEQILQPHHEQQPLCTTRLPYRQGRKLTAVKVYTVNNESNHLLVFGVPSLNLRQEAKALFSKFGKLLLFNISKCHPAESFTETYHAMYDRIQPARMAKRMLDTKNFYGGSLHVCYAPEFENVAETRNKLLQRQRDVLFRLINLQKEPVIKDVKVNIIPDVIIDNSSKDMLKGEINVSVGDVSVNSKKRRKDNVNVVIEKKFKPCFVDFKDSHIDKFDGPNGSANKIKNNSSESDNNIEIVDCTSTEKETITNINEHLNYNNFGNEIIRKVPEKPLNKIKFNLSNKR